MKIVDKIKNYFSRSFLGGLYFDFLLLLDRVTSKTKTIAPNDVTRIVRQYSMTSEGVVAAKRKISEKVLEKTEEGYKQYLQKQSDIVPHAEYEESHPKAQVVTALKKHMDFSNMDIKSDTDKAKMIQKRIQDYKALHEHQKMRQALREARRANKNGK